MMKFSNELVLGPEELYNNNNFTENLQAQLLLNCEIDLATPMSEVWDSLFQHFRIFDAGMIRDFWNAPDRGSHLLFPEWARRMVQKGYFSNDWVTDISAVVTHTTDVNWESAVLSRAGGSSLQIKTTTATKAKELQRSIFVDFESFIHLPIAVVTCMLISVGKALAREHFEMAVSEITPYTHRSQHPDTYTPANTAIISQKDYEKLLFDTSTGKRQSGLRFEGIRPVRERADWTIFPTISKYFPLTTGERREIHFDRSITLETIIYGKTRNHLVHLRDKMLKAIIHNECHDFDQIDVGITSKFNLLSTDSIIDVI
jgi:hypothetical protein